MSEAPNLIAKRVARHLIEMEREAETIAAKAYQFVPMLMHGRLGTEITVGQSAAAIAQFEAIATRAGQLRAEVLAGHATLAALLEELGWYGYGDTDPACKQAFFGVELKIAS